ncbi:MAG: CoA pyrophosphatase [Acidimicrobiales bacterium]|nr:CoA pyrophosphatase [Acidimicrobiales bacterium]
MYTFDDDLLGRVQANLDAHERRTHELAGRRHAAVALVLVQGGGATETSLHTDADPVEDTTIPPSAVDQAAFVLCRRASRLRSHSAQWALPGGRIDAGETAVQAALREVHEEVGLLLDEHSVIGLLDDYPTRSGYVMTPVVVWAGAGAALDPSPDEVASVHRVGLDELCRDDSPRYLTIPESERPVVQVPLGGHLIHAPTGAVLVQFRHVALEDQPGLRVDHLEQPVFAWG